MKKLIIAANLGKIRVIKFKAAGQDPIEQEHLLEVPEYSAEIHVDRIQETVTDQAGRFGRGTSIGMETGMSYGEEHNLERDMERMALGRIADRIDQILTSERHPSWILAAPQSILSRLEATLTPSSRKKLTSKMAGDLTQCPLPEMEHRFLRRKAANVAPGHTINR